MLCECFEKVNELLDKDGRQLDLLFSMNGGQPALIIPTVPKDGGRRPRNAPKLVAGYCPFCGSKLATKST